MTEIEADEDCVERCVHGDIEAFGTLVEKYQRPIFAAVLHMVGNYEDARELTQQVFMKSFEHLSAYQRGRKFFSWLYRIAINESINHVRARHTFEPLDEEQPDFPSATPMESLERARSVHEAILKLKPEYRAVIVLRHFMDCSYEDAADVLKLPVKTVRSRLFSARQLLRAALEPLQGRNVASR
jgi:RNA polymerase sigma-70 factor (ECF subfamily)